MAEKKSRVNLKMVTQVSKVTAAVLALSPFMGMTAASAAILPYGGSSYEELPHIENPTGSIGILSGGSAQIDFSRIFDPGDYSLHNHNLYGQYYGSYGTVSSSVYQDDSTTATIHAIDNQDTMAKSEWYYADASFEKGENTRNLTDDFQVQVGQFVAKKPVQTIINPAAGSLITYDLSNFLSVDPDHTLISSASVNYYGSSGNVISGVAVGGDGKSLALSGIAGGFGSASFTATINATVGATVYSAPIQYTVIMDTAPVLTDKSLTDQYVQSGETIDFNLPDYFKDADTLVNGRYDYLQYSVEYSQNGSAKAAIGRIDYDNTLHITGVNPGTSTIIVKATDSFGLSVSRQFDVNVGAITVQKGKSLDINTQTDWGSDSPYNEIGEESDSNYYTQLNIASATNPSFKDHILLGNSQMDESEYYYRVSKETSDLAPGIYTITKGRGKKDGSDFSSDEGIFPLTIKVVDLKPSGTSAFDISDIVKEFRFHTYSGSGDIDGSGRENRGDVLSLMDLMGPNTESTRTLYLERKIYLGSRPPV